MSKNEKRIYWLVLCAAVGIAAAALCAAGCAGVTHHGPDSADPGAPMGWWETVETCMGAVGSFVTTLAGEPAAPIPEPYKSAGKAIGTALTGLSVIMGGITIYMRRKLKKTKREAAVDRRALDATRAAVDALTPQAKKAVTSRISKLREADLGEVEHRIAIDRSRKRE